MRKLLLLLAFLIPCLYALSQTDVQQDNRVHPILKWALTQKSGYITYGRPGPFRFINMAVLNQSSKTLCWFTCHGRLFDSTKLTDLEFERVTAKQLDPFVLYQNICDKYLADIAVAKDIYRVYEDDKIFYNENSNYRALFAMEPVQAAKTPLQKLIAIENIRKRILTQVAYLDCANPFSLQDDPLYKINKDQAGTMIQTKDSTVYCNIDPNSAVARISLYKNSPGKLYVQNRLSEIIDSVPILAGKYDLLKQEKTDVFLLYRGWLELQWQDAMNTVRKRPESVDVNKAASYRQVNTADETAVQKEFSKQLNAIGKKINLLVCPEAKAIEQTVYDIYKNESSEINYMPLLGIGYSLTQARGVKEYELTNHLGNVLATVSDKKNGVPSSSDGSLIDHYEPDIVSAHDFYPFGMLQPGRSYLSPATEKYRYGFNGKENDNEVKGEGNQQDYGMRVYDPRLGKFLSVDPLMKDFPYWTPYQFSGNNPIRYIDLDGAEQYDPQSKPTGIVYLPVAKAPGIVLETRSINIGNYELRGIVGQNGTPYWIARYHFKEGKFKGMYNDEFVVGPDGVKDLARNPEGYHNKAEWATLYGNTQQLSTETIWEGYKETISNPINWIAGAGILASGIKSAGRSLLKENSEAIIARGISGRSFTESSIKNMLKASEDDVITLYRGMTGSESGKGALFLTEDAAYAASYNANNVTSFTVSRSGFNYLKSEGLIETKMGINASNGAKGTEIMISNQTVKQSVLNAKQ